MADLKLTNVFKRYGEIETIHGIDLDIKDGEFVVFVGPSGCGKSTLLRMIAGLEQISEGDLHIDGECVTSVAASRRGVAMVFQSYALYPHMSVRENMAFGLKMAKTPKAEIKRRVDEAAQILQLEALLDRKPKALSGGQRQRVAIGRTIVRNPKVFLFDEPLSNLDAELRVQMRVEIAKLHAQLKNTMIYVTHDQTEAMTMADKIVVLRAGNIEQVGTPLELYLNPVNEFVAGFIGSPRMNFFECDVTGQSADALQLRLPCGREVELEADIADAPAMSKVKLGIRPEHLQEDASGEVPIGVEVDVVEHLGGTTYVYARYAEKELILQAGGLSKIQPGQRQQLSFNLDRCHLFDCNGKSLRSAKPVPEKAPMQLQAQVG
ncbi:sn-glycerol-3-phosphate ABC transporter ATP-binding protein UgpC [Marinobacterium sp. D7]|uniref:ABC transporter ATP-binding protein n=1 Tax=Marinobacterium ramblicola TaxID=2849041 RepID=UPI001C2D444A|nr:sn-glycerol-3-phosphate ABC transporter ATP-binding protein UgpC [Marinobacterium ramblicola]MBV1787626.1 sn-glycerol-3-phosphate ABC transporter ATP-binding protein UgpC [Marinobacterium ramblicola]